MNNEVTHFEDSRWASFRQSVEFRHTAALDFIEKGPVLDVGCGDGLFLGLLRNKGVEATGVDISNEAVAACTKQGLRAQTVPSASALPFPDSSFEYVVMLDILEHVYDPVPYLVEARRVSRGYVIVGVPNFSSLPARIQVLRGVVPENNRPQKGHIYWFNHMVLHNFIQRQNLSVVRTDSNTFFPFSMFGKFFSRILPNLFALSFVVLLRKENKRTT